MIEKKKSTQAEWYRNHVLTPEQCKKLLEEKVERARRYCEAIKKQEALLKSR